ncbi:MAG: hypothetical protein F6K40_29815 [Okeania sp. SIO3I5]|uniref:hypothetical protein n=1 Tax=Okeania sp. SIO3I5 TaxID=2607805 RepID=UPI0013BD3ADC|nr:hypothetical protein [Okeania sp. SIO3I5]NEQ40215.1 hypothetical protein [Okeania sp. SIO3I5]
MSNTGQGKKTPIRRRISVSADDDTIEKAYEAIIKQNISSKRNLAKESGISSSTITNFFAQKPILLDKYNKILETLKLGKIETKESIDKSKVVFTITGRIDEKLIEEVKSIIEVLRKLTDGNIYCSGIELGSIKLILEGSQSALEKIEQLFQSGELNQKIAEQNLDITVENVSFRGTKFLGKPQLAVIIPGDYNQADINTLKSEFIDTSANNIFKQIPLAQMLLLLLLFFFLAVPLIIEGIFPIIFQDTPKIENKR